MALALASCGGGVTPSGGRLPSPSPTASPGYDATISFGAAQQTATFAPLQNGIAASLSVPPVLHVAGLAYAPQSGIVQATFSQNAPAGVPPVSTLGASGIAALGFIAFAAPNSSQAAVSFPTTPSFTFTPSSAFSSTSEQVYLAAYDPQIPSAGWTVLAGPVALAASQPATFAAVPVASTIRMGSAFSVGSVYALIADTGPPLTVQKWLSVRDYPIGISGGGPYQIVSGAGGDLWFTLAGYASPKAIGRMSTSGAVQTYKTVADTCGITSGPDGAVWFTEQIPGIMARIDAGGTLTEQRNTDLTGFIGCYLTEMNDAVWSSSQANYVFEFGPGGNYSWWAPGPNGGDPLTIVAGNGVLWYADDAINAIVKVVPAQGSAGGSVYAYTIPTPNSGVRGVTLGPDGALWFTENIARKIGRLMGSSFTEYPLPPGPYDVRPQAITSGPDGALWFTSGPSRDPIVTRITTSGAISEYPIPTLPVQNTSWDQSFITTGPDGALWFTEYDQDRIGRIEVPKS